MAEIRCPIMDCSWSTNTDLPDDITDHTLAGIFGIGAFRATQAAQKRQTAEDDTRQHLESHGVLDFVKTIKAFEELVASQVNTILELTGQKATFGLVGLALDVQVEPKT